MDRRELLRTGSMALLALAIPGWAEAFAGNNASGCGRRGARKPALQAALESARARGWPLLVLRAPAHPTQREQLGEMWGMYLSLAGDDSFEDLALCEIVCATDAEVLHRLPSVAKADGWRNSIALLVEPDDSKPKVVAGPLVRVPPWDVKRGFEDTKHAFLREIDRRLHAVIAPDRATLERRSEQSRKTLTPIETIALGDLNLLDSESIARHAERVPARLRVATDPSGAHSGSVAYELVDQARKRLKEPPTGSRWEDPWWEPNSIQVWVTGPCGAGIATARGVRFLHFLSA